MRDSLNEILVKNMFEISYPNIFSSRLLNTRTSKNCIISFNNHSPFSTLSSGYSRSYFKATYLIYPHIECNISCHITLQNSRQKPAYTPNRSVSNTICVICISEINLPVQGAIMLFQNMLVMQYVATFILAIIKPYDMHIISSEYSPILLN